jgi:hypothetical protein
MKTKWNNKLIECRLKLKSKKQIGQWCTLHIRREKRRREIKWPSEFDHHNLSHATPDRKGHDGTSRETVEAQLYISNGITHAV